MKKLLFLLCTLLSFAARAQLTLTLQGGGTTGTFPSNASFNLDLQFTTPSGACYNKVRAVLNYTPSNPANSGGHLSIINAVPYNGSALFNSYPQPFGANNQLATNIVTAVNGASNMFFSARTLAGVFCNNTTVGIRARIYFYNASNQLCDSIVTSNGVTLTITAQNRWTIVHDNNTNAFCLGAPALYRITVDHPTNIDGSYNLNNVSLQFSALQNAVIDNVLNDNFQPIPFTTGTGGGFITATFNSAPLANWVPVTTGNLRRFYVVVRYPCAFFSLNQNLPTTVRYSGTSPCNEASTEQHSLNVSYTQQCCNGGQAGQFRKWLVSSVFRFCPGNCNTSTYRLEFDNSVFATTYPVLNITDTIQQFVNVTAILTELPAGAGVTLFYRLSNSPGTGWIQFTGNPVGTIDVTALPGWVNGVSRLTHIRWEYTNFPGFTLLANFLRFRLDGAVNEGTQVSNTAWIRSAQPPLNLFSTTTGTVDTCRPQFTLRKQIHIRTNNSCVQNVLLNPGDTVRFRFIVINNGAAPLQNGQITDVLNPAFEYVPGSESYFFGNTECPTAAQMQPFFAFPGSPNIFLQPSGQSLTWHNVNVPNDCPGSIARFVIEFAVVIRDGTLSGTYNNNFNVTGSNTNPSNPNPQSSTATVNVGDYLNLRANLEVACRNSLEYTTDLKVRPGEQIRYRATIRNVGNIAAHSINAFNVRPQPGDISSCCGQPARNSQVNISYTGINAPAAFQQLLHTGSNCAGVICGGTTCTNNAGIANMQSASFTSGNTNLLQAGQQMVIEFDAVVGTGSIGQMAFNDIGANGRRADNNNLITAFCSNLPKITIDSTGCAPECACGSWQYTRWEYINSSGQWVSAYFKCGDSLKPALKPGNTHPFYFKYNCNDTSCHAQYNISSDLPATAYTAGIDGFGQFTVQYKATDKDCGWHYFRVTPRCGDQECEPCIVYFYVDCPPQPCGEIIKDTIVCTPRGPVYSFCVKNNSNFTAHQVKIKIPAGLNPVNITPATGATYIGNMGGYLTFNSTAGIAPGGEMCTFSFTLAQPYYPGQQICLGLALHKETAPPYITCCEDTTYKKCFIVPDCPDPCIDILKPSITCSLTPKGYVYTFNFSIINHGLTEVDSLELQYINPVTGNVSDLCNWRLTPAVQNSDTGGVYTCTLPFSPAPGSLHCFRVIGYDLHWLGGVWCIKDSCISEMVCVKAPDCRKGEEGGGGEPLRVTTGKAVQNNGHPAGEAELYQLFPNPASRSVTITGAGTAAGMHRVVLSSASGRMIATFRPANRQQLTIDISKLPPGLYLINVNNERTYKLIKN